jgi:copper chaperone NosL
MRTRFLLPFLFALLLLAACGPAVSLDEPPEIRYGEDECDRCRMLISDARYAAAYMTEDGTARRFDDIGGMLAYHAEQQEAVHLFWVHDAGSQVWVRADEATFVLSPMLQTPMGFGIAAYNSADEADAAVAEGGELLTFDALLARAMAGELDAPGMGMDMGGMD